MASEADQHVWLYRAGDTRLIGSREDLLAWARSGWLEPGDLIRLPGQTSWDRVEYLRGVGHLVKPRASERRGGMTLGDGFKLGCGVLLAFFLVATVLGVLGLLF